MKKYLTPVTRSISIRYSFQLLQQHSVNAFKQTKAVSVGDVEEDTQPSSPSPSRYVGDFDED